MWLAGLVSAFSIKLTSSVDDVVWLAPFLNSNLSIVTRSVNVVIYVGVCLVQTLVAMLLATGGNAGVSYLLRDNKDAWSSDRILTVSAGGLLLLYTVKLIYDSFQEEEEDDDEKVKRASYQEVAVSEEEPEAVAINRGSGFCCGVRLGPFLCTREVPEELDSPEDPEAGTEMATKTLFHDEKGGEGTSDKARQSRGLSTSNTLFIIAFIGSIDDLTVFVPMLVGKAFDIAQLVIGTLIASTFIVLLCIFLGMCKPIADCLSSIPLYLITGVFAASLLVRAATMH